MLTKATIRLVTSLRQRKFRRQEGLFVAEGPRLIGELLPVFRCRLLLATEEWAKDNTAAIGVHPSEIITHDELSRISALQTPQQVVALFEIPSFSAPDAPSLKGLHIALDGVQDPGNFGTIIRVADWFGIHHLWCSSQTADVWNPKVVQATMGGIARVQVHYVELPSFLSSLPSGFPVYDTKLDGQSLWHEPLSGDGIIVMGNEGNGVSDEVSALCQRHLFIPNYQSDQPTTESLNVAMATGIVLAEFRRRQDIPM